MQIVNNTKGQALQAKVVMLQAAHALLTNGPRNTNFSICDYVGEYVLGRDYPSLATNFDLRPYMRLWPLWNGRYSYFIEDPDSALHPVLQHHQLPHWEGKQGELRRNFLEHLCNALLLEIAQAVGIYAGAGQVLRVAFGTPSELVDNDYRQAFNHAVYGGDQNA